MALEDLSLQIGSLSSFRAQLTRQVPPGTSLCSLPSADPVVVRAMAALWGLHPTR